MAFEADVDSFSSPTSATTKAVTGTGFRPKAGLFSTASGVADHAGGGFQPAIGFATSPTNRAFIAGVTEHGSSAAYEGRYHANDACIGILGNAAVLAEEADLDSWDSDGFTLDYATSTVFAIYNHYVALGGDDLTDYEIVQSTMPTSATTKDITFSFQPDTIILITTGDANTPGSVNTSPGPVYSIGFCDKDLNQFAIGGAGDDGGAMTNSDAQSTQANDACLIAPDESGGGSLKFEAAATAWGPTVTLNFSTASVSAEYFWVLAIKGPQCKVSERLTGTSTGDVAYTGTGFQPKCVLAISNGNTSAGGATSNDIRMCFGATSGSSNQSVIWGGVEHDNSTSDCSQASQGDEFLNMYAQNGASPTAQKIATLSSLDSDGFTLNFSTADASNRRFGVLEIGNKATGHAGGKVNQIPLKSKVGGGLAG